MFQSITGVGEAERCQFYLESSNWNLDLAISAFFDGNDDDQMQTAETEPEPERKTEAEKPKKKTGMATMAAMLNLDDDGDDKEPESDDDDGEGQAFYAGGSEHSGQQILGPPKKKRDFVSHMFKKAREAGGEVVEGGSSSASGPSRTAFTGAAFKLGSDTTPSEKIEDRTPKVAKPREFTLKMWENGFSIDDGELRDYNDTANREFLRSVMTGRIPDELIKEARGGEVHVNMEDHKHEQYVKPKVKPKPFQGAGHTLGGAVPSFTSDAPAPAASSPSDNAENEKKAKERAQVDESKPMTSLQIRLPDGTRLVVKLNHTHTVAQLREYVTMARPTYATTPFTLATTFPNKTLDDDASDLKSAGLLNAAVLLRPA